MIWVLISFCVLALILLGKSRSVKDLSDQDKCDLIRECWQEVVEAETFQDATQKASLKVHDVLEDGSVVVGLNGWLSKDGKWRIEYTLEHPDYQYY